MKITVVGASGYLGSELLRQAIAEGYEGTGTYCTHPTAGLERFSLEDESTWDALVKQGPDVLIWSAWSPSDGETHNALSELMGKLQGVQFVYISSDIVLCDRTLAADTPLGAYARKKRDEQATVLAHSAAAVFTVGPVYGTNSSGVVDKRTQQLLDEPHKPREYWSDVFKSFVPVKGLARTVLSNLDKSGQYFVGPRERLSYFDFYKLRAQACGLASDNFHPTKINDEKLAALKYCRDSSYAEHPKRLWSISSPN